MNTLSFERNFSLSQLVEPTIESCDPAREELPAPPAVVYIDEAYLLVGDDDLDLMQEEAELEFLNDHMNDLSSRELRESFTMGW